MSKFANKITSGVVKIGSYRILRLIIAFLFAVGMAVSLFSNGLPDEYLYLYETANIANLLKEGKWIGADLTGTHGFIFKLPVSIFFLLFEPSLFIARLFNVYLACIFIYVLYSLGKKLLNSEHLSIVLVILTASSYQFIRSLPTYLREIPVLLSLVLFLSYLKEKKAFNIWSGLFLLIILESKEYVAVILGIALAINFVVSLARGAIGLRDLSKQAFLLFMPSAVYTILMLYTNVIPYNDMLAKSLFIRYNISIMDRVTISSEQAPLLRNAGVQQLVGLDIDLSMKPSNQIYTSLKETHGNSFYWKYLEKLGSPRSFSVTSITKTMTLLAIFGAFRKFKKNSADEQAIFIFFLTYLLVFFLKATVERYLLPLTPVIFYYFLYELEALRKEGSRGQRIFIISLTLIITSLGFIFDNFILIPKILINSLLLATISLFLLSNSRYRHCYFSLGMLLYSALIFSMWFYSSYNYGPIYQYARYGRDFENPLISGYIIGKEISWYNGDLHSLYMNKNLKISPSTERLSYDFPKKKIVGLYNTPYIKFKPTKNLASDLRKQGIENVFYVRTTSGIYSFPYQSMLDYLISQRSLKIEEKILLKNKELLILSVPRKPAGQ